MGCGDEVPGGCERECGRGVGWDGRKALFMFMFSKNAWSAFPVFVFSSA
jgi:hypothetical protein